MTIDLFPHEAAWCKQRQEWWDLHGFVPRPGCLVLITSAIMGCLGLEGIIVSLDKDRDEMVVRVREYPECPWIEQKILRLPYYGVDPVLYDDKPGRPEGCDYCRKV